MASTVAWGIFVWIGFVLFPKQGCIRVQGKGVCVKLVITPAKGDKVATFQAVCCL